MTRPEDSATIAARERTDAVSTVAPADDGHKPGLLDPYSPDGCEHLDSRPCIECRRERCEDWYDAYSERIARVADLEARVAAVRDLHERVGNDDLGFECFACGLGWPCPTIAKLGGAR